MKHHYSSERSIQILISLLKQHGIKKVIASPGSTNATFVASIQQDPWFEIYSSVDERSAAYIACGMAAESGEPVVLTCTGATASRNYMPGLTEAYYRKLPVLAVTATQNEAKIGHLFAQVIDRSSLPNDIALLSEHIPITRDDTDEWSNTVKINRALLELRHRGGGPVHLNVATTYSRDYSVEKLPAARMIRYVCPDDTFPKLPKGRIAVFVGAHRLFTEAETAVIDRFCASHDAVVFCDHTSGYNGKYRVQFSLVVGQDTYVSALCKVGLLVHIGEVSADYLRIRTNQVWRVNPDGALRDTFKRLLRNVLLYRHHGRSRKCTARRRTATIRLLPDAGLYCRQTVAPGQHVQADPSPDSRWALPCIAPQMCDHLYDRSPQAYGRSPGTSPYVSFKKAPNSLE